VAAGSEFGVVGDVQRGPLVVGRLRGVRVRPDAEHVVAEVGQHPQVVVFGDDVARQEQDVHRTVARNSPTVSSPPRNVTLCVLSSRAWMPSMRPAKWYSPMISSTRPMSGEVRKRHSQPSQSILRNRTRSILYVLSSDDSDTPLGYAIWPDGSSTMPPMKRLWAM